MSIRLFFSLLGIATGIFIFVETFKNILAKHTCNLVNPVVAIFGYLFENSFEIAA